MPRRREVPKRETLPDPKYSSQELAKFVNVLMTRGKKSVAERIVYGALDQISKKTGKDPLEVFTLALNNVRPMVEVKSRRVGGANYQVRSKCVRCAAMRWQCAGCAMLHASAPRNRWMRVWQVNWPKPRKAVVA